MRRTYNHLSARLAVALVVVAVLVALGLALRPGQAQEGDAVLQYPPEPPAPTVGPQPTLPPALASAPMLTADFATAEGLAGWQPVELDFMLPGDEGVWEIRDGRLRQNLAGEIGNPSMQQVAALAPGSYGDGVRRVSFYDEYNGVVGLISHYQGAAGYEASYYRFRALKSEYEATPKLVLERVDAGVVTALATLAGPGFAPRMWHTLELRVAGGELMALLDGKLVLTANDPQPLAAGQVGVYTRAFGGLMFDDFVVAP